MNRSWRASFYIPIILVWGSVFLSTLNPVLIQSDIWFEPDIQRNDLLRIDPGGDIEIDGLVIYRLEWVDYVARVIGLPGDEILLGIDGNSIVRNGERVAVGARGLEFLTDERGSLTVAEGQAAVYLHNGRGNPVAVVIGRAAIRGPVEKIYRYSNLERSDWLSIVLYSAILIALVLMPFASVVRGQRLDFLRLIVLVSHTFMTLVVLATLLAIGLPGDPLNLGVMEPIWWWFPLAVVTGFGPELILAVGFFLTLQWLRFNKPWRR